MTADIAVVGTDLRERFAQLAAPIPREYIEWRRDGRPAPRGDKMQVRVVAYISAQTVQRRLDSVFPGDWSLALQELPACADEDGVLQQAMKATLTILGLSRECIGMGSDPKNAATDALKRAAVRYGIGAELYDYPAVWVDCDSSGEPIEDVWLAYERACWRREHREAKRVAQAVAAPSTPTPAPQTVPSMPSRAATVKGKSLIAAGVRCPMCKSEMWDNRRTRVGKQPDYKCTKSPSCNGAIWLEESERRILNAVNPEQARAAIEQGLEPALVDEVDELPF